MAQRGCVDAGRSLSYVFEDRDWLPKLLVGGLISIVPVLSLAVTGYEVQVIRNVAEARKHPLPPWTDLAGLFVKGLLVAVAHFLYAVPALLLGAMAALLGILGGASTASGNGETLGMVLIVLAVGFSGTMLFYALALSLWLPGATATYAAVGEFSAFFRFREIWDLVSDSPGDYAVALLIAWLAALVAGAVGSMLLLVGAVFTAFWATLVSAHALGQVLERRGTSGPSALAN